MIQAKALFCSDSSIVSSDIVCLKMGPDSAIILARVSHLNAQYLPVHLYWALCPSQPHSENLRWNRWVLDQDDIEDDLIITEA